MTQQPVTQPPTTQHSPSPSHNSGKPPISGGKAIVLLLVVVVLAVILAVTGIIPRLRARTTLQEQTNRLAAPNVLVDQPQLGQPSQEVVLPGNIQAYTDSPIYARTSGYIGKWYFDIGAHVKQGQLLASIESPEVDRELAQAKADLATAQANAANAQIQSARYQDLLKGNAVSKQDTDNFTTQAASTTSQVQSNLANVQRLQQLVDFARVIAPFDGIVTARNIDTGTLIDAGANRELFHLAAENVIRVYVNVPQLYSLAAVPGVTAVGRTNLGIAAINKSIQAVNAPGGIQGLNVGVYGADPEFFSAMGMRLLAGRLLGERFSGDLVARTADQSIDPAMAARGLNIVVNRRAAAMFGFRDPAAAVGQQVVVAGQALVARPRQVACRG